MLTLFRLFRPQPESSFSSSSFALITLVGITACGELPDETRIEAPRILALRQEVTSSWLGLDEADKPPRAQAMPFETVTVSSYLATPTGELDLGTYLPVWLACELRPGEGLTGCISRERAKFANLASIPPCQPANLDAIDIENLPGESPLCRLAGTSTAQFEVPLTFNLLAGGSIEFSMIAAPIGEANTSESCADRYLQGDFQLPNECIYAVQRLPIGPQEALEGLLLSSQSQDAQALAQALELVNAEADRHPRITALRVAIESKSGVSTPAVEVAPGEVLQAKLGDRLKIEIDSPEEDLQSYLVPGNLGENGEIRSEYYEGKWYRTFGDLLSGQSEDPLSFNRWDLEVQDSDATPIDGQMIYLYYTVRDTRSGTNWRTLAVQLSTGENTPQ